MRKITNKICFLQVYRGGSLSPLSWLYIRGLFRAVFDDKFVARYCFFGNLNLPKSCKFFYAPNKRNIWKQLNGQNGSCIVYIRSPLFSASLSKFSFAICHLDLLFQDFKTKSCHKHCVSKLANFAVFFVVNDPYHRRRLPEGEIEHTCDLRLV